MYTGSLPAKVDDAIDVIALVLDDVAREGITAEELEQGKGQLRAAWFSIWRSPAHGWFGWARPNCSPESLPRLLRRSRRSMP